MLSVLFKGGESANLGSTLASFGSPHGDTATVGSTIDLFGVQMLFVIFDAAGFLDRFADAVASKSLALITLFFVGLVCFTGDCLTAGFVDTSCASSIPRNTSVPSNRSRQFAIPFLANRGERRSGDFGAEESVNILVSICWIRWLVFSSLDLRC